MEVFPIINGEQYVTTLWINGEETLLSDRKNNSWATSVYVAGNDVYIAGYEEDETTKNFVTKIWKNGIATSLTDNQVGSKANHVFVLNADVYVTGSQFNNGKNVAYIWKNGIATQLSNGTNNGSASSVYVSDDDLYVVGSVNDSEQNRTATLWKNNFPSNPLSPSGIDATANSVFVMDKDVYVGVSEDKIATVWKNGEPIKLTDGTSNARVSSVFVTKN